ncbi:MAG: FG-GAP-like repeat-containing protein [Nitrospirales bacterium]|nr:FG-GAP-like repeat-containing protein [Nitrospirales bacterium]
MRQQLISSIGLMSGFMLLIGGMLPNFGEARTTTRVSVSSTGEEGNSVSREPRLNGDGRLVAFDSCASNLVPGDTNGACDVFVHDRQTGQTTRVSVSSAGAEANNSSSSPALSADGRLVAFISFASNLVSGDTNGGPNPFEGEDVFVHDRQTGQTTRVNVSSTGEQAIFVDEILDVVLSADGRFVAFDSASPNLVSGATNGGLFVHDRQTGQTTLVPGNGSSPALSADGRFVAFISTDSNLVGGDTNGLSNFFEGQDVFVHNRQTGQTTRVNVSSTGEEAIFVDEMLDTALSADGRFVAFDSASINLVPGDTNGARDIFVHDRQTGLTTRVSVSSTGAEANGGSSYPRISANGRFVAFTSYASNLVNGDTNGVDDVFVHDRQTGQTTRVNVSSAGVEAAPSTCDCFGPAISGNGRFVAFTSNASNLAPGDTNDGGPGSEGGDIFVHDLSSSTSSIPAHNDLNGDGKTDLVWRNSGNGATALWLMNGTGIGSFGFPGGVPLIWQIAGVGDVNGDGKADVIWRHGTSGTVAVWVMNGVSITSVGFPGSVPTNWRIQGVGDVNGDGKADLVWRNSRDGNTAIWMMNGTSIGSSSFLGGRPLTWQIAGVGDVDGNGREDVIWRNGTNGDVAVWEMNGAAIASIGFPGSASTDLTIAGVGDVNGDGKADLVWHNTRDGNMEIWLLNGKSIASTGTVDGKILVWKIAKVGDVNGDGKVDVIWRNGNTGELDVWLMNGISITSTGSPGAPSPAWEVQVGGGSTLQSLTLTVTRSGSGNGIVISNPTGINCGTTCSAGFSTGESLSLTALSDVGSTFAGWSGGGCSGTSACTFLLTGHTTVNAVFNVDTPDPIKDKHNGIAFRVQPTDQDGVYTITWTVGNNTLNKGANEFSIELFVGGGQQWLEQVVTDEPTEGGIPIVIGSVPPSFCFRMVATANGTGPILGTGYSGNLGPCL